MSYFRNSRNMELSILYYLETNLAADWAGTTVVKAFKKVYAKEISLPIVCVRLSDTQNLRKEIGSTSLNPRYLIIIDLFCKSDAQRLDLADYIIDKLNDGWTHYEHSHMSGDKTSLERVADGRGKVDEFVMDAKLDIGDSSDEKDRCRHNISIRAKKS